MCFQQRNVIANHIRVQFEDAEEGLLQRRHWDHWYVMALVNLTSQFIIPALNSTVEDDGSNGISAMFRVLNGINYQSSVVFCSFGFKAMVEVVGEDFMFHFFHRAQDIEPYFRSPPTQFLSILLKFESS